MRPFPSLRRSSAALALWALAGCSSLVGIGRIYPYDSRPMIAPAWYHDLYDQMVTCLGQHELLLPGRSYESIEWFQAKPEGILKPEGPALGIFSPPRWIIIDERWVMELYVVTHEIGHYLSGVVHPPNDPPEAWAEVENLCVRPVSGVEVEPGWTG